MTRSARPSPTRPQGVARRVKRGIVAGYLHEISARHRPAPAQRIVNATVAAPEPCAAGASAIR